MHIRPILPHWYYEQIYVTGVPHPRGAAVVAGWAVQTQIASSHDLNNNAQLSKSAQVAHELAIHPFRQ